MNYNHVQRIRILYKTILKLHRGLPAELQVLGSNYTRDEFRRHKKCSTQEAEIFLQEWTKYAVSLAEQLGISGVKTGTKQVGLHLSGEEIEHLRNEQIYQLYELMKEATGTELKNKLVE